MVTNEHEGPRLPPSTLADLIGEPNVEAQIAKHGPSDEERQKIVIMLIAGAREAGIDEPTLKRLVGHVGAELVWARAVEKLLKLPFAALGRLGVVLEETADGVRISQREPYGK